MSFPKVKSIGKPAEKIANHSVMYLPDLPVYHAVPSFPQPLHLHRPAPSFIHLPCTPANLHSSSLGLLVVAPICTCRLSASLCSHCTTAPFPPTCIWSSLDLPEPPTTLCDTFPPLLLTWDFCQFPLNNPRTLGL